MFKVFPIPAGPMQNVNYILMDETSREAVAIDSGWETEAMVKEVDAQSMKVRYVMATHGHFDHTKTLPALAEAFGATLAAHEKNPLGPRLALSGGERLPVGSGVHVLATPGHSEDSICIYDGAHLFTGDTLFIGYWGRTDLKGGSSEKLFDSLHEVIMRLPAETVIFPGHDYGEVPSRTLGEESTKNPALLCTSHREFASLHQE